MEHHTQDAVSLESNALPETNASPEHKTTQCRQRCRARRRDRKQCRLFAQDPVTGLCSRHAAYAETVPDALQDTTDLSNEIFAFAQPVLESPEHINAVLSNIVTPVAKGRISSRRAAVITYALSLMLRSVLVIDKKASDRPLQIEWSKDSWRPACAIRAAAAAEAARNSSEDQTAPRAQDGNRADAKAGAQTRSGNNNGENYDATKSYSDLRA
jgi:hypothetical protein